jgi:type III secretion system low calcium response chaperone LcrH/SycD
MSHESLNEFEALLVKWQQEGPIEPLPHMTPERTKEVYYIAYRLYRDQRYEEAVYFFRLLTVANPFDTRYWKGLGACLQMQKQYEEAINCYICTQLLKSNEPDPYVYVHAADCYFALGRKEEGLQALKGAQWHAEEQGEERVLTHIALMHDRWSK